MRCTKRYNPAIIQHCHFISYTEHPEDIMTDNNISLFQVYLRLLDEVKGCFGMRIIAVKNGEPCSNNAPSIPARDFE